jgi:hypothetical protein
MKRKEQIMPNKVKAPPRLWKAIGAVELAGQRLSNIAYNLAQHKGTVLTAEECATMDETRREWDEAHVKLSQLLN